MTQYDETNSGALFKAKERKHEKSPDLTGKINIGGVEYWLSGWTKRNENNSLKVISLKVQAKDEKPQRAPATRQAPPSDDFGDDIPFN
jgi:hypothetical protein